MHKAAAHNVSMCMLFFAAILFPMLSGMAGNMQRGNKASGLQELVNSIKEGLMVAKDCHGEFLFLV